MDRSRRPLIECPTSVFPQQSSAALTLWHADWPPSLVWGIPPRPGRRFAGTSGQQSTKVDLGRGLHPCCHLIRSNSAESCVLYLLESAAFVNWSSTCVHANSRTHMALFGFAGAPQNVTIPTYIHYSETTKKPQALAVSVGALAPALATGSLFSKCTTSWPMTK